MSLNYRYLAGTQASLLFQFNINTGWGARILRKGRILILQIFLSEKDIIWKLPQKSPPSDLFSNFHKDSSYPRLLIDDFVSESIKS